MKICRGTTRIVFVISAIAIKIPNFTYSWHHFLKGLLCNISEGKVWRYNGYDDERRSLRDELLCPVIWSSWGGWVIIMARANPHNDVIEVPCAGSEPTIEDYQAAHKKHYARWIEAGFGGDDKQDNYGLLNGRVVKLDYGQE